MPMEPFYSADTTPTIKWANVHVEDAKSINASNDWDIRMKLDTLTVRMSYAEALSLAQKLRAACGA